MTTRKPKPVTEPAVHADDAFGNVITANRDTAVVEEQALRSQLTARIGQYERDQARLDAEFRRDEESLINQIGRQESIIRASDAALASLKGEDTNVVAMAAE